MDATKIDWKKKLGIKTKGEEFVLNWILDRDKNRHLILLDIEKIKLEHKLITVKCRTRHGSYWFSVSDLESKGWIDGMTQEDKENYISRDLEHKME